MARKRPLHFRHAGFAWAADPEFRPGVERLCADLEDPGRIDGAVHVKSSRARSVWRMSLQQRAVYVKRYRVRSTAERLKYLVATPRAQAEWRAARLLAERGIEAAAPLAVGVRRRGPWLADAFFVADEAPGIPFADALVALRGSEGGVAALLRETAALHERLAEAGVVHADLHGGNMLVVLSGGGPRITLVDLHGIRFPALGPRRPRGRATDKLAHSLWRLLSEEEFAEALYLLAPGHEADLRRRVDRVERVRLRSRSRRCVLPSTQFARERVGAWTVWRRREVSTQALLDLAARAPADAPRFERVPLSGATREVCVQRRTRPGWLPTWKSLHALGVREIPTWKGWACLHRRRFGLLREAVLVTEHLPDARPVEQVDPHGGADALVRAALDTAARLHRAGLPAPPDALYARRAGDGWEVLCSARPGRVPDRPLPEDRAARERAALVALVGGPSDSASR